MLAWIILVGGGAIVLTIALIGLIHARRHLVLHTQTLTPYTERHAEELERRVERLTRESCAQTSALQDSLESLRSARSRHE
jgi:C4-dicarboxylate-specific signal transduction histidine kinase